MTIAILFWVLYLVALILGFTLGSPEDRAWPRIGNSLLLWVLLGLLGWGIFGSPIRG